MSGRIELTYVDMHTAGEPVRIVTGGYPDLAGTSVLAQRRDARERFDRLRTAMMLEPRGHAGILCEGYPHLTRDSESRFGCVFTHFGCRVARPATSARGIRTSRGDGAYADVRTARLCMARPL